MTGYILMIAAALCGFLSAPIWSVVAVAMALTLASWSKHRSLALRYAQLGAAKVFGTSVLMLLSNNFVFCLMAYGLGSVASLLLS